LLRIDEILHDKSVVMNFVTVVREIKCRFQ